MGALWCHWMLERRACSWLDKSAMVSSISASFSEMAVPSIVFSNMATARTLDFAPRENCIHIFRCLNMVSSVWN